MIVNALVNPSSEISHGFEGTRVETKEGGIKIDGILVSDADPLVIKSVGAMVQRVPRSAVKSITKMNRSLMPQPELLGLDAQKISDIAAYLKSDQVR